jgi:hypothetical protein
LRRNQELLTDADRARLEQVWRASRQRRAGDEAARKERAKQALVLGYQAAAAQVAGRPTENTFVPSPREAMNAIVDFLANVGSEEEAARLLGLTRDEVTAARREMHQFRLRLSVEHFPEHKRERMLRRLRKMPWPPPV